jgi:heme exporter protein B
MKRDFLTNSRSLIDLISIIGFMLLIIFLFPLGIGPDKEKLGHVSNAIIWIGLILAILPSLEKILQKDYESGWLDQIATTDVPLEIVLLSKSISYWLIVLIPLILSSPLFAILLSMELKYLPWLILSMSIGGLGISLIGLNGSALILGAKRGNILLPILIIPLMIPILIFGVGINEAVKIGESPFGNLFLLMALTLIYLVISPFISALLVRIAIGR